MTIIGAISYLLSPFDVIPEAIFGVIGFIDDFGITIVCLFYVATMYMSHLRDRNERQIRAR